LDNGYDSEAAVAALEDLGEFRKKFYQASFSRDRYA
jgi:hypothetical protein